MNRHEFIDKLRAALSGRIPANQVEDTVSYYQDYIATEIRKGKSEEEVMALLGDPRLIARTIIQTSGRDGTPNGGAVEGSYEDRGYEQQGGYAEGQPGSWFFRLPRWLIILIVVVIVLLIGAAIFSILSFFAPLLIVMAAVIFLVKLFRDWLN